MRVYIAAVPCGYIVLWHSTVDYTDADRAWFRAPIKGGK